MNIVIIGYGKMGKAIEKIAVERSHNIIAIQDRHPNAKTYLLWKKKGVDCALEFTHPQEAHHNVYHCIANHIPVVSGTTGWSYHDEQLLQHCRMHQGTYFHATNFSIGANIVFKINAILARIIQKYPDYTPSINEIHHTEKVDMPSGTAITLAQDIVEKHKQKTGWQCNLQKEKNNMVNIISQRKENVVGTHKINYNSLYDAIQLTHEAKDRKIFALGAVLVAEWIQGKTGILSMEDFLHITN